MRLGRGAAAISLSLVGFKKSTKSLLISARAFLVYFNNFGNTDS